MAFVRLRYGTAYVNADELPATGGPYLLQLTARQVHIARRFLFPHARVGVRLVRPVSGDVYEVASDAELTDFIDDLDALADGLGGAPEMVTWATTAEIADVSTAEAAGTSDTVPRGDHAHAVGLDIATVTHLLEPGGVGLLNGAAPQLLTFGVSSAIGLQAHMTSSIASGGTVVELFDNIYATGLLFLTTTASSVAGTFALARGSCVALGTLPANISTVKDTASKLNVYYDSDNIVKAQNNYSTPLVLRLMWLSAGISTQLNATI